MQRTFSLAHLTLLQVAPAELVSMRPRPVIRTWACVCCPPRLEASPILDAGCPRPAGRVAHARDGAWAFRPGDRSDRCGFQPRLFAIFRGRGAARARPCSLPARPNEGASRSHLRRCARRRRRSGSAPISSFMPREPGTRLAHRAARSLRAAGQPNRRGAGCCPAFRPPATTPCRRRRLPRARLPLRTDLRRPQRESRRPPTADPHRPLRAPAARRGRHRHRRPVRDASRRPADQRRIPTRSAR